MIVEGLIKDGMNIYMLYSFLKKLTSPFDQWPAFSLGIIDKDGNVLKTRSNMSNDERSEFPMFDLMILNLKKLIMKLPGGSTKIATFAAALFLLKEGKVISESSTDIDYKLVLEKYIKLLEDGLAPTNTMGSGAIANPQTMPLFKKAIRRKK